MPRAARRQLFAILLLLVASTLAASYINGRYAVFAFLFPLSFPFALASFAVAFRFIAQGCISGLKQSLLRIGTVLTLFGLALAPSYFGFSFYDAGLRDHVRSTFTAEVIDQLRKTAIQKIGQGESAELSDSDVPAAIRESRWGFPRHRVEVYRGTNDVTFSLEWGSALIGHHGITFSKSPIPPKDFPVYGGDDPGPQWSGRTYTPWLHDTYIMLDIH